MIRPLLGMGAFLIAAILLTPAIAQGQRAGRDQVAEIRKITTNTIKTPEYDVKVQGGGSSGSRDEWVEVEVTFETNPNWVSELDFTYYILCEAQSKADVETAGGKKYNLFTKSITHRDIPEGKKHLSAAYLHPSTYTRFGKVSRAAVVISHEGAVSAFESDPGSKSKWWESPQLQPAKTDYILNRWETPFIYHRYEDYGQIKLSK